MLLKRSWTLVCEEDGKRVIFRRHKIQNYGISYAFCQGCIYFDSKCCHASAKMNKTCNKYRYWINKYRPLTPPKYICY